MLIRVARIVFLIEVVVMLMKISRRDEQHMTIGVQLTGFSRDTL